MGFMDIFKKMFVSNSQIKDIININDMVQIPTRDYFKDNEARKCKRYPRGGAASELP